MRSLALLFPKTPVDSDPNPDSDSDRIGQASGEGTVSAGRGETIADAADGGSDAAPTPTASSETEGESKRALIESPPTDDVCPICFGNFVIACRAPCGHWFCGSCILQYWNFSAALQPCKCPMCSQCITKLVPEASLYQTHDMEISKVLQSIADYNRLFVGGIPGFMVKVLAIPVSIKRMFYEMMNPDRPGVYLHEMRLVAMFLGVLYSFIPFDFLRMGRHNIINVLDYSAFALSFVFYLVGLYVRWRRRRNVREMAGFQAGRD